MAKSRQMMSLRIDPELEHEILFIKKRLNLNSSKSIKEAIHSKYLQLKEASLKKSPGEILESSGFIGSFVADENLSADYKMVALKAIKKKHGR